MKRHEFPNRGGDHLDARGEGLNLAASGRQSGREEPGGPENQRRYSSLDDPADLHWISRTKNVAPPRSGGIRYPYGIKYEF
jgi:hypothetical protein